MTGIWVLPYTIACLAVLTGLGWLLGRGRRPVPPPADVASAPSTHRHAWGAAQEQPDGTRISHCADADCSETRMTVTPGT